MTALIFAPLAASVAFLAVAIPLRSVAPQGVPGPRAVSGGEAGDYAARCARLPAIEPRRASA